MLLSVPEEGGAEETRAETAPVEEKKEVKVVGVGGQRGGMGSYVGTNHCWIPTLPLQEQRDGSAEEEVKEKVGDVAKKEEEKSKEPEGEKEAEKGESDSAGEWGPDGGLERGG